MREAYYTSYTYVMSQPNRTHVPGQGDWGIAVPFFAGLMAIALVGFWPAMVWHGYGGPTGNDWRWDIHSTIGCCAYWGVLALLAALIWAGHRPGGTAAPTPPRRVPPRPGPDPAVTMRLLKCLDEIDGYAAEAEKARTGEELDYLNAYGRLPGRERNPQ